MTLVEMRNVSKSYASGKARTHVLHHVSLAIEKHEFVAILGFSGSGKTTLISLLAGLIAPDHGTITMAGRPITGTGRDRSVVFQNYSLLPWLSAYSNVALAVDSAFPQWSEAQRNEHVIHHLEMVNLGHALDKKPKELSGGMRQRVAVARALSMDPDVLLLDEPLSALDALTRGSLQRSLERICSEQRKTVVLITNDVDESLLLADRVIPLTPGPRATLGQAFEIDLPRPRDPRALNHDPKFKRLRNSIIRYLGELRDGVSPSRERGDLEPALSDPESIGAITTTSLEPLGMG